MTTANRLSERYELGFIRLYDAPVEEVWQAWTDPAVLAKWLIPEGITPRDIRIDFRVGGSALWNTCAPVGKEYFNIGIYREIKPGKKIVYTQSFADRYGNSVPASYYEIPGNWPSQVVVTVIFEDWEGKTRLRVRQTGIPEEMKTAFVDMWNESLDRLGEVI